MLTGGRPVSALTKDCCYRDISTLAEDLQRLQQQKSQCDANYKQSVKSLENALLENERLNEKCKQLSNKMEVIAETAYSVESEANLSLSNLKETEKTLRLKLEEYKKRIKELESKVSHIDTYDAQNLKEANMKIKFLKEQLKNSSEKGKFLLDYEYLCLFLMHVTIQMFFFFFRM